MSWLSGDATEHVTALDDGTTAVGKDGKLSWICEVPSQRKMNVMLQWEVSAHVSPYTDVLLRCGCKDEAVDSA